MQTTFLSLPEVRNALLRFRGREMVVSGHSDLPLPPFPIAECKTILKEVTLGPQPKKVVQQKEHQKIIDREHKLEKRRGHPRTTVDFLHVRGIEPSVVVDLGLDDVIHAYADGDWNVVVKTHEGEVHFSVNIDLDRPLSSPPFEHEVLVDGSSVTATFKRPLMEADIIEVAGKNVRVIGVDRTQKPPLATGVSI